MLTYLVDVADLERGQNIVGCRLQLSWKDPFQEKAVAMRDGRHRAVVVCCLVVDFVMFVLWAVL